MTSFPWVPPAETSAFQRGEGNAHWAGEDRNDAKNLGVPPGGRAEKFQVDARSPAHLSAKKTAHGACNTPGGAA